jgi:serine/threonine protein kinase
MPDIGEVIVPVNPGIQNDKSRQREGDSVQVINGKHPRFVWDESKKIGSGSFGVVYAGVDCLTNEAVVAKIEKKEDLKKKKKGSSLEMEYNLYQGMFGRAGDSNFGLPVVLHYYQDNRIHALFLKMYEQDLGFLLKASQDQRFSLKTTLMIGIQLLDRIHLIHNLKMLHRDIKPSNFVKGFNDNVFRIIDFGLAKEYVVGEKTHIPLIKGKNLIGTPRYVSLRTHEGLEQSRRDDMESLVYLIISLLKPLPWNSTESRKKEEMHAWIKSVKEAHPPDKLCQGLPGFLERLLAYVRRDLHFIEKPDYDWMRSMMENEFHAQGFKDDDVYDWDLPRDAREL